MRIPYDSDISLQQFEEIKPMLKVTRFTTKPTTVNTYDVFCAVLYLLKTGCQWRMLPRDFPNWKTVYSYWVRWSHCKAGQTSALERALKKSGWRGPRETGAQRLHHALDRGRAECEEHGHG
jgi:transposase